MHDADLLAQTSSISWRRNQNQRKIWWRRQGHSRWFNLFALSWPSPPKPVPNFPLKKHKYLVWWHNHHCLTYCQQVTTVKPSFRRKPVSNRRVVKIWSIQKNRRIIVIPTALPDRWARPAGFAIARRLVLKVVNCCAAAEATKRERPRPASTAIAVSNGVARSPVKFAPSRNTSTPVAESRKKRQSRILSPCTDYNKRSFIIHTSCGS